MKTKFFFWLLVFQLSIGQSPKILNGKISVNGGSPAGVLVLNLVTEKETISNFEGKFSIEASPDDLLVFQSNRLEYARKSIDPDDFARGNIQVYLQAKPIELEEIKIFNFSRINAVSMGILSKPAKIYTPAQRKLKTATDLNASFSAGNFPGVSLSLDPLINAITGRTKMLKKYVAIEMVQLRVVQLQKWFSNEYLVDNFKLKEDQLSSFLWYAAEDDQVGKAMNLKNKFLVSFELMKIAENFKNLQKR